jgi:prepilin-type N-terminal cleavage/methylation domain-containing protein
MGSSRSLLKNEQGFTLLEVIIAITIMVLAFASILAVESNSIGATIRAKEMNIVAMLARGKMIEMEYKVEGKTFEETQKEDGGNFETPYESFRWKTEVREIKFPNMSMGGGKSANGDDDQSNQYAELLTKLVTKFFSKAVRELVVTIFWKHDSTEVSYSVSTYWVDLNHEFETSE